MRPRFRRFSWLFLLVFLVAERAAAWLPTTPELRRLWERDRALGQPLWLEYEGSEGERLEVLIRPDGLWGKRVHRPNEATRTTYKWGQRIWLYGADEPTQGRRVEAGWDDWLFEPWAEILVALEPRETFAETGLGRFPEGLLWVIGGRHERAAGHWIALEESPLRMRRWQSARDPGSVLLSDYDPNGKYPTRLTFQRTGRAPQHFYRTAAESRPNLPRLGWTIPAAVLAINQPRPTDPGLIGAAVPR